MPAAAGFEPVDEAGLRLGIATVAVGDRAEWWSDAWPPDIVAL
jgi:hypothetical protein